MKSASPFRSVEPNAHTRHFVEKQKLCKNISWSNVKSKAGSHNGVTEFVKKLLRRFLRKTPFVLVIFNFHSPNC